MIDEVLFSLWVEKETKASLNRKRSYPHFDPKINFNKNISFFRTYFGDPKNVVKHSFYPFIRMIIETPRYKKTDQQNADGKFIRVSYKKPRPLAYSAHFDAFIYSWFSTQLSSVYERKIKEWGIYDNVLAYVEKDSSNIEFSHEVFEYIRTKGRCVALAFDITSFFDGLDHEHLKTMWGLIIDESKLPIDHYKVYNSITNYTYVDKEDLEKEFPHIVDNKKSGIPTKKICEPQEFRDRIRKKDFVKPNSFKITLKESPRFGKTCGIPQGSPISACLSNIYMIDFDKKLNQTITNINGLYRRYCDDIIVVVDIEQAEGIRKYILDEIKKYHLEINDGKTEVTFFKSDNSKSLRGFDEAGKYKNLQYLGFEFNGQNAYLRSSSMSRYNRRLNARIRESLKAAYGSNAIGDKVFKKKLFNRYTEKGERNFITYAKRAKEHMKSETIHKQYKNSILKVKNKLEQKKQKFEDRKKSKYKP